MRMRAQNKKLQVKLVKGAQSLASTGYTCTRWFWLIQVEERAPSCIEETQSDKRNLAVWGCVCHSNDMSKVPPLAPVPLPANG